MGTLKRTHTPASAAAPKPKNEVLLRDAELSGLPELVDLDFSPSAVSFVAAGIRICGGQTGGRCRRLDGCCGGGEMAVRLLLCCCVVVAVVVEVVVLWLQLPLDSSHGVLGRALRMPGA